MHIGLRETKAPVQLFLLRKSATASRKTAKSPLE
jgi:hypothetical protein